jgi:putative ABC transport system substrate-binding protein
MPAGAQQNKPVIGMLGGGTPESDANRVTAFLRGLNEAGYAEGRNVAIERRWAEQHYDRMPALAAELVARKVDLIAAMGGIPSAVAAKPTTTTIPILFALGGDPIKLGLVASLNRPGGNVTGVSFLINTVAAKQLEVLHEAVPKEQTIAFLGNAANPDAVVSRNNVQIAAVSLGRKLIVVQAESDNELETAFETLAKEHVGALMVGADFFLVSRRAWLVDAAAKRSLPAIYPLREFAEAGGLMSYGTNLTEAYRLTGHYAARILNGEKPANLPVQQSTKIELVVNLKTAKALGLTIPPTLLARADEVIE